ncbi:MAG: PQQ-dependent sugar dehydrogenase [Opitutaceae bacterium]
MVIRAFLLPALLGLSSCLYGATNVISDQLPAGKALADYGLGARATGSVDLAVQLVELATLPGGGQVQQIVGRGDSLFVALKEGRIWEYDLDGNVGSEALLDVAALRPLFNDATGYSPSRGLRGFAFHPDYAVNGLVYTAHKENQDATDPPEYGTSYFESEYVLAEWNFNQLVNGEPTYRQLFRVRFEHVWHTVQQLGFDSDGYLYACFGDNGAKTGGVSYTSTSQLSLVSDVSNVGQDFNTIHAGVIRIDPLDPSSKTDGELLVQGLRRSDNGKFSIPLDNPYIDIAGHREELFAKGFRNPLSLTFSPQGRPIVADVGEHTAEEINVLFSGGNYGWPNREGTFLVPWCDQVDGSPLGADESMVWMPSGAVDDPAVTYYVRDKNQMNLVQETLARSGASDDGFKYPVFQFTHEGNNLNGTSAVVGGDYYEGFWSEELSGIYLFGNISTDQIFYGAVATLDSDAENAEMLELPLVDASGVPTDLAIIVGNSRANMRFGKDSYGNLYLASKTNWKLYRFQGTPKLILKSAPSAIVEEASESYFEFCLERPPADGTLTYTLEVSEDLAVGFTLALSENFEVRATTALANGMERVTYRYLVPVDPEQSRFFRFDWE